MKKINNILSIICMMLFVTACSNDIDTVSHRSYLKLKVNTLVSTTTRATDVPSGYAPKTLHVEIIKDGTIVNQTDDFANDEAFDGTIELAPGTYTIKASSAKWDGTQSGYEVPFYYADTTFVLPENTVKTIPLTCKQANVKFTFNWDDSFKEVFDEANVLITSDISGVNPQTVTMDETRSVFFPVGNLTVTLSVNNQTLTTTIDDAKARDHFIITYKLGAAGNMTQGQTHVYIDDATHTYTYEIEVPRKSSVSLEASANEWSNFAFLNGELKGSSDYSAVTLEWKAQNASEWTQIDNNALTKDNGKYSYKLTNLTPNTGYVFRLVYEKDGVTINSEEVNFTTEEQTALYNGGFEDWNQDGYVIYPNATGTSYWDTSNPGSAGATTNAKNNVTTSTTDVKHSGTYGAQLQSKNVVIAFAAASIYTGAFGETISTKGAWLTWGVPFTARPTSLKGWYRYDPVAINKTKGTQPSTAPAKGDPDQCSIYWALTTSTITVDNTKIDETFPNWQTDSRVVAYGELPLSKCVSTNGQLVQFEIPIEYHSLTTKPTHIIVCASSSRYGDYFHGGVGSTLYLDDFELVYGNTPTVKQ